MKYSQGETVLTLVQRARRRLFHNELFNQGAHAAAAILIGFILLLLAGTQFLDWRWMALVAVVSLAAALYRARQRRLSLYAAAQVVDRRMALADTISTAVHFEQESSSAPAPLLQYQRERANQAAESVDVRTAVPYAMPRGVYLLAVLTLVAGSLFGLRYGILGHLDLHPPLTHMLAEQLGWKQPDQVARSQKRQPPLVPEPVDDAASASEPDQQQSMQPDTSTSDSNDAANESAAEKGDPTKGDAKKDGARAGEQSADSDQEAQAESNPSQGDQKSGEQAGKQDQKQQSGGKPDPNNSSENSLVNKAKDLFQNLLSSLKPPSSNPGQQQNDQNNQGNKGQQKQQGEKNGQQKSSGQQGDQSQGEQGEQMENQEQSPQGNGKSDSQQATKQPGSGAGSQEGDKRIKQAEDLAAMGKITEILGKRANTLTGEATIEVQNTSQQLKTAYAPGVAQHGQSGGEINRDEIPVAMEPFVQEYFKQARKAEPAAPATTAPVKKQ
jgi:hypothetical protein